MLWEELLRGEDLVTEIPAERWDAEEYHDSAQGVRDRSVSRWGGFIDDIDGFDIGRDRVVRAGLGAAPGASGTNEYHRGGDQ
jgi:acyl transferase domain-containing protein